MAEGRTPFFAEFADVIGIEFKRLLRYTLRGYAMPLSPEREEKAERDVALALRGILEQLGRYVDSAAQSATFEESDEEEDREEGDREVFLKRQLDKAVANSQRLGGVVEGKQAKILSLLRLLAAMRTSYYRDLEGQRDRFRVFLSKKLPGGMGSEAQECLSGVKYFDPTSFVEDDNDEFAIFKEREAQLMSDFEVEREAMMQTLYDAKEAERYERKRFEREQQRATKLRTAIDDMASDGGAGIHSGVLANMLRDDDALAAEASKPRRQREESKEQTEIMKQMQHREEMVERHTQLLAELGGMEDLLKGYAAWLASLPETREGEWTGLLLGNFEGKVGAMQEVLAGHAEGLTKEQRAFLTERLTAEEANNQVALMKQFQVSHIVRLIVILIATIYIYIYICICMYVQAYIYVCV